MVLVDTNIFVEIYRGRNNFIEVLESIGTSQILVSHVTLAELFFGARNSRELNNLEKDLIQFQQIPISDEVSNLAVDLV